MLEDIIEYLLLLSLYPSGNVSLKSIALDLPRKICIKIIDENPENTNKHQNFSKILQSSHSSSIVDLIMSTKGNCRVFGISLVPNRFEEGKQEISKLECKKRSHFCVRLSWWKKGNRKGVKIGQRSSEHGVI